MYNWSTDEEQLKKNPEKYAIWRLEQMVNFGIGSSKIKEADLKRYWDRIEIDESRRKFLAILLHK